jgi:hypothetical protein
MIQNTEKILLNFFDFNLFVRDKLIIDRVGLLLESIRILVDPDEFERFVE